MRETTGTGWVPLGEVMEDDGGEMRAGRIDVDMELQEWNRQ